MSKYCVKCGAECVDEAKFCLRCGYPLEHEQTPAQEQNPYQPESYSAQYSQPYTPAPTQPQSQQYQQPYQQPYTQQYGQQYQQPYMYPQKVKIPGRGFGISSMVMGILACVYSLSLIDDYSELAKLAGNSFYRFTGSIMMYSVLVFISIFSILALVFGILSRTKGYKKQAIAGIIMGGISMAIVVFSFVLTTIILY